MKQVFNETVNGSRIVIGEDAGSFTGVLFGEDGKREEFVGTDLEQVKASLRNAAGRLHPNYVGISGAVSRFSSFFPDGFRDEAYLRWERTYKDEVRNFLDQSLSVDAALKADADDTILARKAFGTNILSSYENARIHQLLGTDAGPEFLRAAALFAAEPDGCSEALQRMVHCFADVGRPSWPLVTYLPYFWKPEDHIFLKPEATKDFAERVGSAFAHTYEATIRLPVYNDLQAMVRETKADIASLQPKDGIDVQSFIWVVGSYSDDEAEAINAWKAKQA